MKIARYIYFFFAVLLVSLASCNQAKLSDARRQYLRGEYHTAGETYRKLYRDTPREQRALRGVIAYEMAENYRRINHTTRAATAYANAIRYGYPDTLMYLRHAQMLHKEGKYPQAIEAYRDFLEMNPGNIPAMNGLKGAEEAIIWREQPTRFEVRRMDLFNSRRGEFSPMLAQNDEVLYITSSRDDARGDTLSPITGMKYNDFFRITKNDRGEWQKPEVMESELNTEFDEGVSSISSNGDYLYYTFSVIDDNNPTTAEIYVSKRVGGTWSAGQPIRIVRGDSLSVFAHPSVSPSGDYLYFVSDMPGGYGGKDIWRAGITADNDVLFVENLGPDINTPGDELFPCVRNDSTIYFSSDGHPGMGGLDIFKAVKGRGADRWQIENMRYPVNSPADDFGITILKEKEKGFFSSNRNDARGYDHIYSFEYPDVITVVEGIAVDLEDERIPGVTVTVIGDNGWQRHFTTNRQGEYRFQAERNVGYLFMATAEGFLNRKKSLRTSPEEKDTIYYVDFEMLPYTRPVILENIFYDFDKATLRPESKEELDGLVSLLEDNPEVAIELSAHTDRKGNDEYNQDLSLRRAQSVVDYLIAHGIDSKRLSAMGYGKTRPKSVTKNIAQQFDFLREGDVLTEEFIESLASQQQEIADQINRRTEFRVTDTDFGLH